MNTKWVRSNEIVWEELGGEALLVKPGSGERWSLNAFAAAIWKMCDGSRGLSELTEALAEASGSSLRQTRAAIVEFCARCTEAGLLRTAAGTSGAGTAVYFQSGMGGMGSAPMLKALGLGQGPRKRPSPRGNSGPG